LLPNSKKANAQPENVAVQEDLEEPGKEADEVADNEGI